MIDQTYILHMKIVGLRHAGIALGYFERNRNRSGRISSLIDCLQAFHAPHALTLISIAIQHALSFARASLSLISVFSRPNRSAKVSSAHGTCTEAIKRLSSCQRTGSGLSLCDRSTYLGIGGGGLEAGGGTEGLLGRGEGGGRADEEGGDSELHLGGGTTKQPVDRMKEAV